MTDADTEGHAIPAPAADLQRLWTPWRMGYVTGGVREDGCLFCNCFAADDRDALIVHRGERAFVIMNLFPYNTGHVMLVPNAHISTPEDADPETTAELAALRSPVLRALRRALNCDGFNLGLNVGAVAGAGVAEHMHEHVVPRWQGDANFMPILASTRVLPELIPVTYAKLRAELGRETTGAMPAILALTPSHDVLLDSAGHLPRPAPTLHEPVFQAAMRELLAAGAERAEVADWAGNRVEDGVLLLHAEFPHGVADASPFRLVSAATALAGPDAAIIRAGLDRLAPPP